MECVIAGHTMDAWSTINKILQADVSTAVFQDIAILYRQASHACVFVTLSVRR